MSGTISPVFLILLCQFGLSMQACQECMCCKDPSFACDSNKTCLKGCIDGYYTEKCTKQCLDNCKTCVNAIQGAESEKKKSLVVIAASTAAGVAVIVLLVILVICLIKRNRRFGNKQTENTSASDIPHVDGSPVAYEDLNLRVDKAYSQITTNQQISPPEAVYVNT
ncbi:uncharacterized protein LOC132726297 [Ruditapes philippinarum]|uniref:uncharacterized protein LOC132726297 n=1 Tax=Ruditapes philippinarum TaxID=129788 RepID=UPI00295AE365|nr:uncharacterized protein LOC132726297 [Ruditapes philippinarum]